MTKVLVALITVGVPALIGVATALVRLRPRPHRDLELMSAEIELLTKIPDGHPAIESLNDSLAAHAAAYEKRSQPKATRQARVADVIVVTMMGLVVLVLAVAVAGEIADSPSDATWLPINLAIAGVASAVAILTMMVMVWALGREWGAKRRRGRRGG